MSPGSIFSQISYSMKWQFKIFTIRMVLLRIYSYTGKLIIIVVFCTLVNNIKKLEMRLYI